ncbi:MAG: SycD/LcrH family type III secretion system chaperone [Ramlibacter sp.]
MQAHAATADPVAALLTQLKQQLESLPSAGKLTEANAGTFYALAYNEYGQGRYDKALQFFKLLLIYRPTNTVYLLGAALCLQRLRSYEMAAAAFVVLSYLEPGVPQHALAQAECHLLCHEREQARETLVMTIDYCDRNPGHDTVRARAQAMLELMKAHHEPATTS